MGETNEELEKQVEELRRKLFENDKGVYSKTKKIISNTKFFHSSKLRTFTSVLTTLILFWLTAVFVRFFPNSETVVYFAIILISLAFVWTGTELIFLTMDIIGKKTDEHSFVKRLSTFSSWMDSSRFGEVNAIREHLNDNREIKNTIEDMRNIVLTEKLKKPKEYYEAFLNNKKIFKFFRKEINVFSKLPTNELEEIKLYLLIPTKKYWILDLKYSIGTVGTVISTILSSLAVSIIRSVVLEGEKNKGSSNINNIVNDLISIFSEGSLNFVVFIFLYVGTIYLICKILIAKISADNEHTRNVLLAMIDRALELKQRDKINE